MDLRALVGTNVRRFRQACGKTQEQVAHEADIDLTYLGGIERGRRNPSVVVLGRIAAALGVRPSALLEGAP